ncbi:MAG: hypothetical protein FJ276_26240 [Planctomycetes bacterium]|nr:hypothetical protein [Planctomycetota bacterium]
MTKNADTRIGKTAPDTVCLAVSRGQRVRISAGSLKGVEAVVVLPRTDGRVLVRLRQGVFLEIHAFCLEKIAEIANARRKNHDQ